MLRCISQEQSIQLSAGSFCSQNKKLEWTKGRGEDCIMLGTMQLWKDGEEMPWEIHLSHLFSKDKQYKEPAFSLHAGNENSFLIGDYC